MRMPTARFIAELSIAAHEKGRGSDDMVVIQNEREVFCSRSERIDRSVKLIKGSTHILPEMSRVIITLIERDSSEKLLDNRPP
jgi:hypothetical protein